MHMPPPTRAAGRGGRGPPLALPTERAEAAIAAGHVYIELPPAAQAVDAERARGIDDHEYERVSDDGGADADPAPEPEPDDGMDEARLLDELRTTRESDYAWEVVVSDCAWRQWRARKGMDPALRRDALRKLTRIAGGQRGARLSKRLMLSRAPQAHLYESYLCVRGWRAVWEEVVGVSSRTGSVRDQILFWGVFDHDRTAARIRYIEEKIAQRPPVELRPVPRPADAAGAKLPRAYAGELPPSAPQRRLLLLESLYPDQPQPLQAAAAAAGTERARKDREADQQTLADVRGEAAAVALLPLANDSDYPSEIAAREQRGAVGGPWPCLVNGRPGTGKSSCAALRLWAGHRAYWGRSRGARLLLRDGHYRAVFLAANAALCREVRAAFCRLRRAEGASVKAVVTRDAAAAADEEVDGMGVDDDSLAAAGAASLADLDEDSFPLFVTRDRWLRLLNGALDRPLELANEKERLVTAGRFQAELWAELCPAGRERDELRAVGAEAAWREVVSHIRGSLDALLSPGGCLTEAQYLDLGRTQSQLDAAQRRAVYGVHVRYEQLKRSPRHAVDGRPLFDHMDLVHHLFRRLRAGGYRGRAAHEAYVDEVQDFTAAEVGLVAAFAGDSRALWLSGDSAQAIARGVSFRFADLRQLFRAEVEQELYGRVCSPAGHAPMRYLTQNYRSHAGIAGLASTVLDVLDVLFPGSLDRLPRDSGIRDGEPPVVLSSGAEEALSVFLFGADGRARGRLGAEQVVVVRTAACKGRVPPFLRDGVVLTVEEAKGLEFDAVLLVDFFRESRPEEDRLWREAIRACEEEVVARATGARAFADADATPKGQGPEASAPRMQAVALELRLLYTAVTRAREHVWIFDAEGGAKAAGVSRRSAFVGLLQKCRAVQDETTAGTAPRRAESSAADWRRKAREYERLGLLEAAARADAIADEIDAAAAVPVKPDSKLKGAPASLSGDGDAQPPPSKEEPLSPRSQQLDRAKKALNRAKERKNAEEKAGDLSSAAFLFEQAGEHARAAKAHLEAGDFVRAADLYERAQQPAEAWAVWKQSDRQLDAAKYYEARGQPERALEILDGVKMWAECFALTQRHAELTIETEYRGVDEGLPPDLASQTRGQAYYAFMCCRPLLESVGGDLPPEPYLAPFKVLIKSVFERNPGMLMKFVSSPKYPSLLRLLVHAFAGDRNDTKKLKAFCEVHRIQPPLWGNLCGFYQVFEKNRGTAGYTAGAFSPEPGTIVVSVKTVSELLEALRFCNRDFLERGGKWPWQIYNILLHPGRYSLEEGLVFSAPIALRGNRACILDATAVPDPVDVVLVDGWKAPAATESRRPRAYSKLKEKQLRMHASLIGVAIEDNRPTPSTSTRSAFRSTVSVRGPALVDLQGCTIVSQRQVCIDVNCNDCEPAVMSLPGPHGETPLNMVLKDSVIRVGQTSVAVRVRQSKVWIGSNEFYGDGTATDTIADVEVFMQSGRDELEGTRSAAGILLDNGALMVSCCNVFGPGTGSAIRQSPTAHCAFVRYCIFIGRDVGVRSQVCTCATDLEGLSLDIGNSLFESCALAIQMRPLPPASIAAPPTVTSALARIQNNEIYSSTREFAAGIFVDTVASNFQPAENSATCVKIFDNTVCFCSLMGVGFVGAVEDCEIGRNSLYHCNITLYPVHRASPEERWIDRLRQSVEKANTFRPGKVRLEPLDTELEAIRRSEAGVRPEQLQSTPVFSPLRAGAASSATVEAPGVSDRPLCGSCGRAVPGERPCQICGTVNIDLATARPRKCLFGSLRQYAALRLHHPEVLEQCKRAAREFEAGASVPFEWALARLRYLPLQCPCGELAIGGLPCKRCGTVTGDFKPDVNPAPAPPAPESSSPSSSPHGQRLVKSVLVFFYLYLLYSAIIPGARAILGFVYSHHTASALILSALLFAPSSPRASRALDIAGAFIARDLFTVWFGVVVLVAGLYVGYLSPLQLLAFLFASYVVNHVIDHINRVS